MDSARRVTDQQISAMRRELAADYDSLGGSMSARLAEYMADFVDEEGHVEATALTGRRWSRVRDELAREVTEVNASAMRTLDGRLGEVRALTAEGSPARSTVPHPAIDQRADVDWNRRKVEAVARQGIGRTPAEAGERMRRVADMNSNATARRVRTAVNGAENAGRLDAMLARGGSKRWVTVQDERVRDSHAALHGKVVPVDQPFDNGLMFPGDPSGPPEEVYNCRCSLEWVDTADEVLEEVPYLEDPNYVVDGHDIGGTWERRPDQFDFEIEDVLDAQGFDGLPRVVDADEFDRMVRQANGGEGLIMQRSYSAPTQEVLDSYRDQLYHGKWYVDCSTGGSQYGQGMYAAADYTGTLTDGIRQEMAHYTSLGAERSAEEAFRSTLSEWSMEDIRGLKIPQEQFDAWITVQKYGGYFNLPDDEMDAFNLSNKIPSKQSDKLWKHFDKKEAAFKKSYVGNSYVETMTLDPSARIVTYRDLDQMRGYTRIETRLLDSMDVDEGRKSLLREWIESEEDVDWADPSVRDLAEWLDDRADKLMGMDPGSFAASMGYDAINAEGHGASGSYTVVLNRTKLIIRRP